MISVEEAELIINNHAVPLESEAVPLAQSGGRILTQEVRADRDFPPFDRVTMDGIAISFDQC